MNMQFIQGIASELCDAIRLLRGVRRARMGYFLRAESFYNVATKEIDYADPGAKIYNLQKTLDFHPIVSYNDT